MATIRSKLMGLGFVGILLACIIGGYAYRSISQLDQAMNKIVVSSSILRNHMYGDMLHDALNSDVNAALLATENVGGSSIDTVHAELKEHSAFFTETLAKNEKLITDTKMREALSRTLPALRNYITSAESIVATAKTDRSAAIKMMDAFHKSFTVLEDEMEALTQLIEAQVQATQQEARDEKENALVLLIVILMLGIGVASFFSFTVIKNITSPLADLVRTSERVAAGNLSVRVAVSGTDELSHLAQAMETMRKNLAEIISQISTTTEKLVASVADISAVAQTSSSNLLGQQSETDQVASAMNEMTATVHEVARNIVATSNSAQKATEETNLGREIVQEAVQSIALLATQIDEASKIIHRVEHNSHNISSVLDVIRNIAEQTNLLALNAAIEAARAGEQGRGFAVVADEVRTLASRTQESTGEINNMISQLQAESKSSVDAMNKSSEQAGLVVSKAEKAGQSLMTIAATVGQISALSAQIATAAEEQTAVSEEINRNVLHINDAAIVTAKGTHKTKDSINQLEKITSDLEGLVRQFKI